MNIMRLGRGRRAPGDAEADLEQRRRRDRAFLDQRAREHDVARLEDFEFGLDARGEIASAMMRRCAGVLTKPVSPKFIDAHVEAADIRQQLQHVLHARSSGWRIVVPGRRRADRRRWARSANRGRWSG